MIERFGKEHRSKHEELSFHMTKACYKKHTLKRNLSDIEKKYPDQQEKKIVILTSCKK